MCLTHTDIGVYAASELQGTHGPASDNALANGIAVCTAPDNDRSVCANHNSVCTLLLSCRVPMDQPLNALAMITSWTRNQTLAHSHHITPLEGEIAGGLHWIKHWHTHTTLPR